MLALEPDAAVEDEESADPPAELCINGMSRSVTVGGREVPLTRLEFDLLAFLARRPRRVFTRDQLLDRVWEYDYPGSTRTVDTHIRRLRAKLGAQAYRIATVRSVGYRWDGTRQERLVIDADIERVVPPDNVHGRTGVSR